MLIGIKLIVIVVYIFVNGVDIRNISHVFISHYECNINILVK